MEEGPASIRFLVITGMSGAGRRTAAHALEDQSWYVVDNLPPSLMPQLLDVAVAREFSNVAVVLDVRTRSAFEELPVAFAELGRRGVVPSLLFLDASDEAIVRRQESVRRPLPLQGADRLLDGIRRERQRLADLKARADVVVDTSRLNVHQLTDKVVEIFSPSGDGLKVAVMSFGFKNGVPVDADVVLDVRFLPNPHWVPELRPQTGLSQAVSGYVLGQPGAEEFLSVAEELLETITPGYLREGKRHVTIAIGCTGGKHRSTAMVTELARRWEERGIVVSVHHRDLGLE